MKFALGFACLFVVSTPLFCEPPNYALMRQEIKKYHDSGAYARELQTSIEKAQRYMLDQVAINQHRAKPKKLALVLDIDETSLSNYDKMVLRDFIGSREQIHREMAAANSPAIQPMLTLYNDARAHHVSVFFVTGRMESERAMTEKNLTRAGFKHWSGLYLRPDVYRFASIIPYKSGMRKQISAQGYTVIASLGDQYSDLEGGYAQKTFKLPNPYYYLP